MKKTTTTVLVLLATLITALAGDPALPAWAIGPFTRPPNARPVIAPNTNSVVYCPMRRKKVHWESTHTFNPAAILKDGRIYMLYRAEDNLGSGSGGYTSRLGLGVSDDGVSFERRSTPVFYPEDDAQKTNEWYGGCEDPRLCQSEDGTYILTYTQWSRGNPWNKTTIPRLAVASSLDLTNWSKAGPAFAKAHDGKYVNTLFKSASIVQKIVDGRPVAARIGGVYWMYFGEGTIYLASSNNLLDWTPVETTDGSLLPVLRTRQGNFDSALVEGGPMALLTSDGVVVFYNGKNAPGAGGDESIANGAYCGGQALFAADNLTHLISRLDSPYIKPELPWERTGQYAAGTTFTEGLAYRGGQWLLYYGCADSFVGVAMTHSSISKAKEIP